MYIYICMYKMLRQRLARNFLLKITDTFRYRDVDGRTDGRMDGRMLGRMR